MFGWSGDWLGACFAWPNAKHQRPDAAGEARRGRSAACDSYADSRVLKSWSSRHSVSWFAQPLVLDALTPLGPLIGRILRKLIGRLPGLIAARLLKPACNHGTRQTSGRRHAEPINDIPRCVGGHKETRPSIVGYLRVTHFLCSRYSRCYGYSTIAGMHQRTHLSCP